MIPMHYRRAAAVLCAIAACLIALGLFTGPALAEENDDDQPTPAFWRDVETMSGTLNVDVNVNLRSQPSTNSDKLASIAPGDVFRVLTLYNESWIEVDYQGMVGYVAAQYVTWWSEYDQVESADEPNITILSADTDFSCMCEMQEDLSFHGTVTASQPIVECQALIFDVRSNEFIREASSVFEHEDDVRVIDLEQFNGRMRIPQLPSGEKQLVVRVISATGSVAEVRRNFYVVGPYTDVVNMTADCTVTVSSGERKYLTDGNHRSAWVPHKGTTIDIALPEDRDAGKLVISWVLQPDPFTVTAYDASGAAIQTIEEQNASDMLYFVYDLEPGARRIQVSGFTGNQNVDEVIVIERDNVSPALMQWQPLPEKIDLLVVSTHQDDELLFIGGTVPYYVAQGKTVGVVYMATCNRSRLNEAMEGLWTCGLRYHPIFLGYEDGHAASVARARAGWGEQSLEDLVAVIRRYKPDVIVTQDVNGEYGHMQHQLTVQLVREAVEITNDPTQFPESAEQYGAWDVKKTYLHLYEEGQRTMTCFTQPLDYFLTLTPYQVAKIGYQKHYSQLTDFTFDITGQRYDNTVFGLYRSTVGDDVAMDDFFEHIE